MSLQRTGLTCSDELSIALVLGLDEVRQDVLVRPAGGAVVRPLVVVVSTASQVLHVVDVARAAKTASQRPVALLADTTPAPYM